MPGRGRPWRGVGQGNPDRIGTGAIVDGSITESDLDTSLQSKVNSGGHVIEDEGSPLTDRPTLDFKGAGVVATDDSENTKTVVTIAGGGAYTKLGEFTVSSAQATMPVTFSASQAPGTYKEILVVADFDLAIADSVDLELTGPSGFSFTGRGSSVTTVPASSAYESGKSDLIGTGLAFGANLSTMKVTIQSDINGNYAGLQDEIATNATEIVRRGGWNGDTNDGTTMTGIVVKAVTNNFNIGSKVSVYVLA